MNSIDRYRDWLASPFVDDETKEELLTIADFPEEIQERFYKELEFGTAGLRGVIGAGTNRINLYTVRRVTQGLANYIAGFGPAAKERGVVIAHDSRHLSPEFALATACTLAANGVRAYLFESLRPTPELSFAVRELQAQAGIVITASHNPPEYNGYKVYGEDGAQIVPSRAKEIVAAVNSISSFAEVFTCTRTEAEASGWLQWIGREIDDLYMEKLRSLVLNPEVIAQVADDLKIVYTPLHGTGQAPVQRILSEVGFTQVCTVPEQELPDPEFSTCRQPNPEEREAFELGMALAERIGADLIIATDPDCDRVGLAVRNPAGEFELLTGNQTGALLLHYLLSQRQKKGLLPKGATMIKTIVTSEMGRAVAERFGVDVIDTLTGFKYIGEQIRLFEETGEREFVFGYEESYGYLSAPFVRDKDAVMATMQICEMAAYYRSQGMTLYEAFQALCDEYGHYREKLISRTLKGRDGLAKIQGIMTRWRTAPPVQVAARAVMERQDYLAGTCYDAVTGQNKPLDLPIENVLRYTLDDGSWFCLRPSGTEPKIKVYLAVQGETGEEAERKLAELEQAVLEKMDRQA